MNATGLAFHVLRFAVLAIVTIAVVFFAGVFALVPGERHAATALPQITAEEKAATLAALKPPKRQRPVVAIIGANDGTETTDYLLPYGVLKRSGVVDVIAVGTKPGPMMMMPSLTIMPDMTTAEFDQGTPDGADFVIVPALHNSADPDVRAFILAQARRGATILSVCNGTLVLEGTGLLGGRRATGHWFSINDVAERNPTMRYVRDRRYVIDRGVGTTTGISASLPLSLALVEAVAGPERAQALANEVGAIGWSAAHDSGRFHLTRDDAWSVTTNTLLSFFGRDTVGIRMGEGGDLIALAFVADSYGRTYRSRAVVIGDHPITTREGMRVLPDAGGVVDVVVDLPQGRPPAQALDAAIAGIEARYGKSTADFVRLQLEDAGHTAGG
jgi:putative intracellular protease/amidase